MEKYLSEVKSSIYHAVSKDVEGASEIGILFSGGLDSSFIAFLAKKSAENANITLYTVGTKDSQDLSNAEHGSKLLGLNLKKIVIDIGDIIEAIPQVVKIIKSKHPVKLTFELPLYLCLANIHEKLILSGQGADELFGGYARYLKMDRNELTVALDKDVDTLITKDIKMDYRIAEHFGKTLKTPYLDDKVVRTASQIPAEFKVNGRQRKIILKQAALELGLPAELVNKEKKAVQYSSGIIRELRRMAKRKGMGVNELIDRLLQDIKI